MNQYYIIETQQYQNGEWGHIVHWATSRLQAESKYHTVLAAAAASECLTHAACMITGEGQHIMSQCYHHAAVAQEVEPEEESEETES